MGKRGEAKPRRKNDAYDTPLHALEPLLPFLPETFTFIEPCAGKGQLAALLDNANRRCIAAFDIAPRNTRIHGEGANRNHNPAIEKRNATTFRLTSERTNPRKLKPDLFISNPPWTWELLIPILLNLYWQRPTWLLLSADLIHNERFSMLESLCSKIVSVGRVRWLEGEPENQGNAPYDNAAWHLFEPGDRRHPTIYGRQ